MNATIKKKHLTGIGKRGKLERRRLQGQKDRWWGLAPLPCFITKKFKYKALNTHMPTSYILPLTFYFVLCSYPSIISIHQSTLFLKHTSQSTHYPEYLSIPIINLSSIFVYGIFLSKTYIQWNAQILSVHFLSFDRCIHLCNTNPYQHINPHNNFCHPENFLTPFPS